VDAGRGEDLASALVKISTTNKPNVERREHRVERRERGEREREREREREKRLHSPFALHAPHTGGYIGVCDPE